MMYNIQEPVIHDHLWLDKIIDIIKQDEIIPRLLLHSCCAPCSGYGLEYLSQYFSITIFFYNPNIQPKQEYYKRLDEQKRFIQQFPVKHKVGLIEGTYEPKIFLQTIQGLEKEEEGGKRCFKCYRLRLEKTAQKAFELKIPYFATTLTISPHKNAVAINQIGHDIAAKFSSHLKYLSSDFKKKEGFKKSILLSKQYHLYRQNYCGCIFSKNKRKIEK